MTFCTVINPASMIKDSVSESAGGAMAHPAIGGRGRMIKRLSYGTRGIIIHTPIMTRGAIVRNTRV